MICTGNSAGRTAVDECLSYSKYMEKITRQPVSITPLSCVLGFELVFLELSHNRCRLAFSYQFPIALLPL